MCNRHIAYDSSASALTNFEPFSKPEEISRRARRYTALVRNYRKRNEYIAGFLFAVNLNIKGR